jgi:hypothetical protein
MAAQTTIRNIGLITAFLAAAHANAAEALEPSAERYEFFEKRIRPVLIERCYECHSTQAKKLKGGLLLDTQAGLLKGGDSGPAIVPESPHKSLLIQSLRSDDKKIQMPPKEKLPEAVVADFETWIRLGAPYPGSSSSGRQPSTNGINFVEGRKFWSFQPPKTHSLPEVSRPNWPQRRIDSFILARLDAEFLGFGRRRTPSHGLPG